MEIFNPVLRGFSPDPSIICVGEDYYIATSTFEWWPGVKLFHSKNLVDWQQLPSPLNRQSQLSMAGNPTSGGVWAPCLTYANNLFWLIFTDVKTKKGLYYNNHNYLVTASNINGPWSEPIYLNSTGFDPSLFHDENGKKYIINMKNGFEGILLQEYSTEKKALVGEVTNIFKGTSIGYTEGPHLYQHNGYYYLIVAEGGTGYAHCITVARSKNLLGPYEVDPQNPMLHAHDGNLSQLQKCGHGDMVKTHTGEWYMAHLCSRPNVESKNCLLGRETALQKIVWSAHGWPRLECGGTIAQNTTNGLSCFSSVNNSYSISQGFFDDFAMEQLANSYVSPRKPLSEYAVHLPNEKTLRIYGAESMNSLFNVSLLAQKQCEVNMSGQTSLSFNAKCKEQVAGLAYMYDAMNFYLLVKTTTKNNEPCVCLIKSDTGVVEICEEIILQSNTKLIDFKVTTSCEGAIAIFSYKINSHEWQSLANEYSTHILTDEHCRGFTGAHVGMYVHDMTGEKNFADFYNFSIKYF